MEHRARRHYDRFLDPAMILASLTILAYYAGYDYYRSYFRSVGIPALEIQFEPATYVYAGVVPALILLGPLLLVLGARLHVDSPLSAWRVKAALAYPPSLLALSHVIDRGWAEVVGWAGLAVIALLAPIAKFRTASGKAPRLFRSSTLLTQIAFAFTVYLAAAHAGRALGSISGNDDIHESGAIRLELLDPSDPLHNTTHILLAHWDGSYYLKSDIEPGVLIVPDSAVRRAHLLPQASADFH